MKYSKNIRAYHDKKRAAYSDFILMYYYKIIRYQCKWQNRELDTLIDFINELEYRGLKYYK